MAGIKSVTVNWTKDETGRWKMDEVAGTEKVSYFSCELLWEPLE